MAQPKNNASQEAGAAMPANPPRENLYRINPDIQLARAADTAMPTMTGHFAVWDQWTEIRSAYEGNFMERFSPGAMTKTLAESTPKVLFQHGKDPQIGDKVLGPITRVSPDETGAYYEVPLLDTSYNRDLIPGLEAGLYGASFRFSVLQEEVVQKPKRSEANPRGIPERTVTEARVMEFGPVTFPAYSGATAGVRSITDDVLRWQLGVNQEVATAAKQAHTVRVSFNGVPQLGDFIPARADMDAIALLNQMTDLGQQYIELEQQEDDSDADVQTMTGLVATLAELAGEEQQEPANGGRSSEPEPSEATTPDPGLEPDPPVGTTRAVTPNKGLYPNREEKPAWLL